MPHDFTEYPSEPEPQPASSRGIRPPVKRTAVDLLDAPEGPPSKLIERRLRIRIPLWLGVVLILAALAIFILLGRFGLLS
jgi:hypothetical protein